MVLERATGHTVGVWWLCSVFLAIASAERFIVEVNSIKSLDNITLSLPANPPACLVGAIPHIGLRFDTNSLFTGFAVNIIDQSRYNGQYAAQKRCLETVDGVARVWASQKYSLASLTEPAFDRPRPNAARDSSSFDREARRHFNSSVFHELTGVNDLHARGITGRNVVVAVLDTGIDYLHPGLGGGFGPSHRVRFGYDFVGDGYLNGGHPVESADPFTECHYHGTHVSGIVGGSHPEVGFAGVAPDVALEMYRCTGCTNQPINSDVVIKAALMAHARGVDVITASFVLEEGAYTADPLTEVLGRIADQGRTVVVFAAGNWGWAGTFSVSAPAAARGILVVGAINAAHVHSYAARARFEILSDDSDPAIGIQVEDFAWSPAPPSRFPHSLPLRAVSLNSSVEDDACGLKPLALSRPDFRDSIVLVRRGGCNFADKMEAIKAAGAAYALIYDNKPETKEDGHWGLVNADNTFHMQGVGLISASTGEHLINLLRSGKEILMTMDSNFTLHPYISLPMPNTFPPGQIAPRSTWGPDGEMGLIPSIVAPGIGIMSTFPRSWGGYNVLSGTSMAAPYVAGCAALVRQAHPEMASSEIVRRLMSTARPVKFHDGSDKHGEYEFLAPTYKQGAGAVDCFAAAVTTTEVSPSHLVLGDAETFTAEKEIHIINSGEDESVYKITHDPAASLDSLSPDRGRIVPMTLAYTENVASDEFLETLRPDQHVYLHMDHSRTSEIRLAPGTETTLRLSFDISGLPSQRCPLYGGFVTIQKVTPAGKGNDDSAPATPQLSIPYAGVACRLRDVPVLQPQSINPVNYTFLTSATLQDTLGGPYAAEPITPFRIFTIPGDPQAHASYDGVDGDCADHQSLEGIHFPTVSLSMAMQSQAVSLNLVPLAQSRFRGVKSDQDGRHTTFPSGAGTVIRSGSGVGEPVFAAEDTTARLGGFSRIWTKYFAFRGQLADGSWVSPGDYVFRVCGVRAWDNSRDPAAFGDCVVTDPFILRYSSPSSDQYSGYVNGDFALAGSWWRHALGDQAIRYYIVSTMLKLVFMLMVFLGLWASYWRWRRRPWHQQEK